MRILKVQEPISGGIFLTYKCNSQCRHCMYACSPRLSADWLSLPDAERIIRSLSEIFRRKYPRGYRRIGVNLGLHFTGGEPFLNYDLLLKLVRIANKFEIPSLFVETNAFWAVSDEIARERLNRLKEAGLHGILISVNPFILEYVPFERTLRAIRIAREVFGDEVLIYQEYFYSQFKMLNIIGRLSFDDYLRRVGVSGLYYAELIPMGRACYRLGDLFRRYPAERFFAGSCIEELTRPWHIHVDNYCNYMTGFCGGISLGDARDMDAILSGINLDDYPILEMLTSDGGMKRLYEFAVKEYGYKELKNGYVSKCHLCVDIRRHIIQETDEFKELSPKVFYYGLVSNAQHP